LASIDYKAVGLFFSAVSEQAIPFSLALPPLDACRFVVQLAEDFSDPLIEFVELNHCRIYPLIRFTLGLCNHNRVNVALHGYYEIPNRVVMHSHREHGRAGTGQAVVLGQLITKRFLMPEAGLPKRHGVFNVDDASRAH
jgi:hypothetical protein